eukprot:COSAG01_NODE_27083_length_695_cov_0.850671_2_plen_36_part_01
MTDACVRAGGAARGMHTVTVHTHTVHSARRRGSVVL